MLSADQRYYSSQYGRFMTPDPYRASGGASDPQSWNRYAYVKGDPINHIDRRGLVTDDPDTGFTPDSKYLIECETFGPNEERVCFATEWYSAAPAFMQITHDNPTKDLEESIRDAVQDALKDLSNKEDCRKLFEDPAYGKIIDPATALLGLWQNNRVHAGGHDPSSVAYTYQNPFTGNITIGISTYVDQTGKTVHWIDANSDYQTETILHELEHVIDIMRGTNQFADSGPNAAQKSWDHDKGIWKDCLGKDIPYPRPQ